MPQFEQKKSPKFENEFKWPSFRTKLKAKTVYSKGIAERSVLKACF